MATAAILNLLFLSIVAK